MLAKDKIFLKEHMHMIPIRVNIMVDAVFDGTFHKWLAHCLH